MMRENDVDRVKTDISGIFVNYLQVLHDCATDKEYRRKFEDNPRPILAEIGMKIPEDAKIILEPDKRRWPGVFIDSIYAEDKVYPPTGYRGIGEGGAKTGEDGTVPTMKKDRLEIREGALEVDQITTYDTEENRIDSNGERTKKMAQKQDKDTTAYFHPQVIEVETGKTWKENRVVVVVPYFDVEKELYAKIKIENEEIVLTAGC